MSLGVERLGLIQNLSVEESVDLLIHHTSGAKHSEKIRLLNAVGRVTAEDLFAPMSQPPFNRSPLDGYAVHHNDIRGASRDCPAVLPITQSIDAGALPMALNAGEAAQVATGAPLPRGATCVVRQEDTHSDGKTVRIFLAVGEYENYCLEGEDVRKGTQIVRRGQRLNCAHVAVLAGQGYAEVAVYSRPQIGILSTGSELISAGQPLEPGKIYDSNAYYLASRVQQLGGQALLSKSVGDDPDKLTGALLDLLSCDMLITTGGVSVGIRDYMPAVGKALNARELFHGVGMKPGSPAMALYKDGKLILCLSGNPFAAAASFEILGSPAVKKLSGDHVIFPQRIKGVLRGEFHKKNLVRRFVQARAEAGEIHLKGGRPGMIFSMTECNCLIDIPAHSPPLETGALVDAILFQEYPTHP